MLTDARLLVHTETGEEEAQTHSQLHGVSAVSKDSRGTNDDEGFARRSPLQCMRSSLGMKVGASTVKMHM